MVKNFGFRLIYDNLKTPSDLNLAELGKFTLFVTKALISLERHFTLIGLSTYIFYRTIWGNVVNVPRTSEISLHRKESLHLISPDFNERFCL